MRKHFINDRPSFAHATVVNAFKDVLSAKSFPLGDLLINLMIIFYSPTTYKVREANIKYTIRKGNKNETHQEMR